MPADAGTYQIAFRETVKRRRDGPAHLCLLQKMRGAVRFLHGASFSLGLGKNRR